MSVHVIYYENGRKMMRPVKSPEEYLALRDSEQNRRAEKKHMVQMNYSCLPSRPQPEDPTWDGCGPLKGANTPSTSVGMDIDFDPQDPDYEQKMQQVPDLIMAKKDELGLLMLERSATKGYHIVFTRNEELSQEENLRWASNLLGVAYDQGAKDITRVFYTPADKLIFLDEELFRLSPALPVWEGAKVSSSKTDNLSRTCVGNLASDTDQCSLPIEGEGQGRGSLEGQGRGFESAMKAFDLCCAEAGLDPTALDVFGQHNWHSNLMAVLSVGLPKLMSREMLWAVIREKVPNYAHTEDCRKLVDYFYANYSAEMGFMNTKLREINAKAQAQASLSFPQGGKSGAATSLSPEGGVGGGSVEGSEEERIYSSLQEDWNPPAPPKKLPRLIQLLIKQFPEQYHPMLIITALVVLGAIGSHFRATYLDGRTIAANLYAAFIAGSGKGKNWVTMLFEQMCRNTIATWDDAEWRKVRENQEMRDKMTNAKDKPAKYHPKFRVMETMSKTSLLEVQTNLGENGMVLCNYTESDELANASKASFSNLSVLLRKAWDLGTHRQYYMSEASCNTQCKLNAAILLTGTPKSVLSRLFSDTENGMMQRFIPMIMPKVKRTFLPPKFKPLSADEQAELDGLLVNLWHKDLSLGDQTLMLDLPKTEQMVTKWFHDQEETYNDGKMTEAEADLTHRVGQFMMRGAIPFMALYGEESSEVISLLRWLGDFSYYNIKKIFGQRVTQDLQESEEMLRLHVDYRKTIEPLLSTMPEYFSPKELSAERVRLGQSPVVRTLLSRYCKKGKVQRINKDLYRNLTKIQA